MTPTPLSERQRPDAGQRATLTVSGVDVAVTFKAIKHVHLTVHPPDGRVRVAAPAGLDLDAVRLAVVGRIAWIRRQRQELAAVERLTPREMVTGESHYLWGRRYRLTVTESAGRPSIRVNGTRIVMTVQAGTSADERAAMYARWERRQLRARAGELVAQWEATMDTSVAGWGTRRMKTKWGSYSDRTGRVWLNTELVKKPPRCLEYIVAHEVAHSLERGHGDAFVALMDEYLPDWRQRHHELNDAPLSAESWPD